MLLSNEAAWEYVRQTAECHGALDAEGVAQDVMVNRWNYSASKGYWATAGRNRAYNQLRKEIQQTKYWEVVAQNSWQVVTWEDFDSHLALQELLEAEPEAFKAVLKYVYEVDDRVKHTNKERKAAEHARWKLRRVRDDYILSSI